MFFQSFSKLPKVLLQTRGYTTKDLGLKKEIFSLLDLEYHYPKLVNFGTLNSSVEKYMFLQSQIEEVDEWLNNFRLCRGGVETTKPILDQLADTPLADILEDTPSDEMLEKNSVFEIVSAYRNSLVADLKDHKFVVDDDHKQLVWDVLDQNLANQRGIKRVVEGYTPYDFPLLIKNRRLHTCLFYLYKDKSLGTPDDFTDEEVEWCSNNIEYIKKSGWNKWVNRIIDERGVEEPPYRYYESSDDENPFDPLIFG